MPSTAVDLAAADGLGGRAADAYRKAAHLAREARELTHLASDAVETRVHAAKRALNRSIESAGDLRDSAVYRVKRNPLKAVGLAFGAGVFLGAVAGVVRLRHRD